MHYPPVKPSNSFRSWIMQRYFYLSQTHTPPSHLVYSTVRGAGHFSVWCRVLPSSASYSRPWPGIGFNHYLHTCTWPWAGWSSLRLCPCGIICPYGVYSGYCAADSPTQLESFFLPLIGCPISISSGTCSWLWAPHATLSQCCITLPKFRKKEYWWAVGGSNPRPWDYKSLIYIFYI